MGLNTYKNLKVWKKSRELVSQIYRLTSSFPDEEKYGITSQLRRAIISVTTNIAEGSARQSGKEFNRFLDIAYSSAIETENLVILSMDLSFIQQDDAKDLLNSLDEIQKMLHGLSASITSKEPEEESMLYGSQNY